MFSSICRALGVGGGAAEACAGCDPAILASCSAAEPGSVTPHAAHVFLRLPPPAGAAAGATGEGWWPESVDKEPSIEAVNAAIKAAGDSIQGKVKVTAYDGLRPAALAPGTCDALVFPAGVAFKGLALDQAPAAVLAALTGDAAGVAAAGGQRVEGATLFVCCHAARDERCGHIGPPLAAKLAELLGQKAPSARVLQTSHVGGHKYAGNVLVYSQTGAPLEACSQDWFGGVNAGNAAAFLDALLAAKAPSGAAGEAALRPFWRGRVGLDKTGQLQHFEAALKDIEDLK